MGEPLYFFWGSNMGRRKNEDQLSLLNCGENLELSKFKKRTKLKPVEVFSHKKLEAVFFDNLIGVDIVAEVLGVAPKTIHNWVSARCIPFIRVGRRVMFRPKSLELWLNRKENKPWL